MAPVPNGTTELTNRRAGARRLRGSPGSGRRSSKRRRSGSEHPLAMPLVSVVIPARNEAENLPWVLERMPDFVDELILVDGHSEDGTIDVARSIRPDLVLVHDGRLGKGEAMRTGASVAQGTFIVMIDADGSMDPSEIGRFMEALGSGFEFAKGSRFIPPGGTADMTSLRRAGHAVLRALANLLFGSRWTDLCYGYCAF